MLRSLFLAAGLLLALPLPAAEKPPMYDVEVLVFSRPSADIGGERWPDRSELSLREENEEARTLGAPSTAGEPFRRLPAEALQLKQEYERLVTAADVEPILHLGWVQPGLARNQSVPVRIEGKSETAGSVDGTLRVILSRYLHVEADLRYRRAEDVAADSESDIFQAPQPLFRLKESRRMRSKEVHYLDHPLFGAVVLITPREAP
ncbi:MAG: CsiV family protein [Thiohalomonadaceae bacterium]